MSRLIGLKSRCLILERRLRRSAQKSLLMMALKQHRYFAGLGWPHPAYPPLVCACEVSSFEDDYNKLAPLLVWEMMDLGTDRLFWYMQGNFVAWMKSLTSISRFEFAIWSDIHPGSIPKDLQRSLKREAHFKPSVKRLEAWLNKRNFAKYAATLHTHPSILLIFTSHEVAGYFIKLVPSLLSGEYVKLVMEFFPEIVFPPKSITGYELEQLGALAPSIITAMKVAMADF